MSKLRQFLVKIFNMSTAPVSGGCSSFRWNNIPILFVILAVKYSRLRDQQTPYILQVFPHRIGKVLPVVHQELEADAVVQQIRVGHRLFDQIRWYAGWLEGIERRQYIPGDLDNLSLTPGQHEREREQTDQQQAS